MECIPYRKESLFGYKFVFLEVEDRQVGQAGTLTIHFKGQPDHKYSNFLFYDGHCGCDNVKTLDVICLPLMSEEFCSGRHLIF